MKKLVILTISIFAFSGIALAQDSVSTVSSDSGNAVSSTETQVKALKVEMEAKIKAIRDEYNTKISDLRKAASAKAKEVRQNARMQVKQKKMELMNDAKQKVSDFKKTLPLRRPASPAAAPANIPVQ